MNVPPRTTLVRSDGSRVVHCSVIMAEQMHAALRAMAKEQDRAISSIVRAALRAYLPNLPPDHFADASKKVLKGGQGRTTDDVASEAGFLAVWAGVAIIAVAVYVLALWVQGGAR